MAKISTRFINFFVNTMRLNNYNSREIHDHLVKTYGEERIRTYSQIRRIASGSSGSENSHRRVGSGRPIRSTGEENVQIVRDIVDGDSKISLRRIEAKTGIAKTTVERIMIQELGLKSFAVHWTPYILTEQHHQNRVGKCGIINVKTSSFVMIIGYKYAVCYTRPK